MCEMLRGGDPLATWPSAMVTAAWGRSTGQIGAGRDAGRFTTRGDSRTAFAAPVHLSHGARNAIPCYDGNAMLRRERRPGAVSKGHRHSCLSGEPSLRRAGGEGRRAEGGRMMIECILPCVTICATFRSSLIRPMRLGGLGGGAPSQLRSFPPEAPADLSNRAPPPLTHSLTHSLKSR